jgi:cell fate regulator YaaT (PSP1 superfamily)
VYYFDPTGYEVQKGDHVIVETARGLEYGTIVLGPKSVTDDKIVSPLKPLCRVATSEDDATNEENKAKEKDAYQICLEKIKKHKLEMKLIDSEYTFDRNKLLFYFTADGRIDFRELVKDLASVFRTRIELRQIGVRDETKLLGGIAICGRPLCCHTYLSDFAPVSIRMAKEQGLSLNPTQISGVCGRLMCCLKNEQDAYEYLNSSLPSVGTKVKTADGFVGEVQNTSVLKQLVKVVISKSNGEREIKEYPVSELTFHNKQGKQESEEEMILAEELDAGDLEQLQKMEQGDIADRTEETAEKTDGRRDNRRRTNTRGEYQKRDRRETSGRENRESRDNSRYHRNYQENKEYNKEYKDHRSGKEYSSHRESRGYRDNRNNRNRMETQEQHTSHSRGGYDNQYQSERQTERGGYSRSREDYNRSDRKRVSQKTDYNKSKRYNNYNNGSNSSRRTDRNRNHSN